MKHVVKLFKKFKGKFQDKIIVLVPDNAPQHHAFADGLPDPRTMNLDKENSADDFTKPTFWKDADGTLHKQVFGRRSLKEILQERKLWPEGTSLLKAEAALLLLEQPDIAGQKKEIEVVVHRASTHCRVCLVPPHAPL